MTTLLTDTTPTGMIAAIETALVSGITLLARTSRGAVRVEHGATALVGGIPVALFNSVYGTQFDPSLSSEQIDAEIDDVIAYYRPRNLPFGWAVLPSDRPADLRQRLVAHGFTLETEPPAMALDLATLAEPQPLHADLTIEEIHDRSDMLALGRLIGVGQAYTDVVLEVAAQPEGAMHTYLARLRGEPVATSAVVLAAGVAGIYAVATVPEARGQGIGAAVTTAAVQAARAAGYRIAILEASQMGYPVYQRMGFVEYCTIPHYVWSRESSASA